MSYNNNKASFNALLNMAFGSITSSYTAVGTVNLPIVCISCVNTLADGSGNSMNVFISFDGSTDHLILSTVNPGVVFDVRTNSVRTADYTIPAGTTVYAKTAGSPASGAVYVMSLVANVGAVKT